MPAGRALGTGQAKGKHTMTREQARQARAYARRRYNAIRRQWRFEKSHPSFAVTQALEETEQALGLDTMTEEPKHRQDDKHKKRPRL